MYGDFSSKDYEQKIINDVALGIKKQNVSSASVVKKELLFWESRIKVWCSNNEQYIGLWKSFLSDCGCGDVSTVYIERLISKVASEKNIKRTDFKFRDVVYE